MNNTFYSPKQHTNTKNVRVVYKAPSSLPSKHGGDYDNNTEVPVFSLLANEGLAGIPEESAIHEGYFVNLTLFEQPHRHSNEIKYTFTGLQPISHPDLPAIERSATKSIVFGSYSLVRQQKRIYARAA